MDFKSVLLVTGGSACSFKLVNTLLRYLPTPEAARRRAWRWRNIITSLAHSSLTGVWAVLCFYQHPQMTDDLISSHTSFSHGLVAVSTGYFIHDVLDMLFNQSFRQSWELLLHHSVVISCFGLAVLSRLYVGFAVVSLLVEVNSVFLHIRQLLLLSGQRNGPGNEDSSPRPSVAYRTASLLNLATVFSFLLFRVSTLGWMTRWLAGHGERIPRSVRIIGAVGLTIITTMNTVLYYRLLRADVLTNTRNASKDQ